MPSRTATGAVVECRTPRTAKPPTPEYTTAMVISGMLRYPAALQAVRRLGEDLFPPGPYRELAKSAVTGQPVNTWWMSREEKELLKETEFLIVHSTLPDSEEWALSFVRQQAERRHQPLLASVLRWTANQVDAGVRLDYLRRLVDQAFAITVGEIPFDLNHTWEPTP